MIRSPYADPDMAAVYDRVAAPLQFEPPGRDLVRILQPSLRDLVLDVGTGTGVVAASAASRVRTPGRVVAVDASIEMLRLARRATTSVLAAASPGLPFRDALFDVVTAGFVVSHFADCAAGLADLVRVCRPGGRIGMSAWGSLANAASQLWMDISGQHLDAARLDQAFREHISWDGWLAQPANIKQALERAGLAEILVDTREYHFRVATRDFLQSREASVQGIVLRDNLTADRWAQFRRSVSDAFHDRFGSMVEYVRDVHFGIGFKPGAALPARWIGV